MVNQKPSPGTEFSSHCLTLVASYFLTGSQELGLYPPLPTWKTTCAWAPMPNALSYSSTPFPSFKTQLQTSQLLTCHSSQAYKWSLHIITDLGCSMFKAVLHKWKEPWVRAGRPPNDSSGFHSCLAGKPTGLSMPSSLSKKLESVPPISQEMWIKYVTMLYTTSGSSFYVNIRPLKESPLSLRTKTG
jgi:hypothetical protein